MERAIESGQYENPTACARANDWNKGTVQQIARDLREGRRTSPEKPPDPTPFVDPNPPQPPPTYPTFDKPRFRVPAVSIGEEIRAVIFSDTHVSPSVSIDHLAAMGRFVVAEGADVFAHLGDFLTMDSCSTHDPNWTLKGRMRPSFQQDMDAGYAAMDAMMAPIVKSMAKPRLLFCAGNHEHRVNRFVNEHPELRGLWDVEIDQLFARHGFNVKAFGDWHFCGGVGLTHVPLDKRGIAIGGVNPGNTVALGATFDICFGHTHNRSATHRAKFGPDNSVTVINTGCSLPDGHVEDYAKLSTTGWWWGGVSLTIRDRRIQDHKFVSMAEIVRRHG
jgi:predicted phosphodiesterase